MIRLLWPGEIVSTASCNFLQQEGEGTERTKSHVVGCRTEATLIGVSTKIFHNFSCGKKTHLKWVRESSHYQFYSTPTRHRSFMSSDIHQSFVKEVTKS